MRPAIALTVTACLFVAPAWAQNQSAKSARCDGQSTAQPATNPAPASRDGTAPGNAGSTGWSGGTGGSYVGTNPSGSLPSSPTWQPPVARGLDPLTTPVKAAPVC